MAGHSRWANIRHRKDRADARRGKLFSRLIKEVAIAAKIGGASPDANPRLRLALEKARDANVPNENIERAIKRGGKGDAESVEEARYEGFGPGGAAVVVECLTDNKNRTVAEVRHAFARGGGNLAAAGAVVHLFRHCGQILFAPGASAEKIAEIAIEAGASDLESGADGGVEIVTAPGELLAVRDALRTAGFKADRAEVVLRADALTPLSAADGERLQTLIEALENLDDTRAVHTNAEEASSSSA